MIPAPSRWVFIKALPCSYQNARFQSECEAFTPSGNARDSSKRKSPIFSIIPQRLGGCRQANAKTQPKKSDILPFRAVSIIPQGLSGCRWANTMTRPKILDVLPLRAVSITLWPVAHDSPCLASYTNTKRKLPMSCKSSIFDRGKVIQDQIFVF